MSKHAELIAQLEAAEKGSASLNLSLSEALNQWWMPQDLYKCAGPWTQSLDAALALAERVLPVFKHWALGTNGGEEFVATVAASSNAPHGWDGVAKNPALAFCIAILKALEAQ